MPNSRKISDGLHKARKKALSLLAHMDRTEAGLCGKLSQAGFSPEEIQDAVEYAKSFGYVNDLRYAGNYIAGRMGKKSRQKIMQELFQKGIDRKTAEEAWNLEAEFGEPDEKAAIRKEIEKKYERGSSLDEKQMRRLYGYLARRGFRQSDILYVIEEMDITCVYGYMRNSGMEE